jgi:hypothetical protein
MEQVVASMAVVAAEQLAAAAVVASLSSPTSTAQPSFFPHGHIAVVPTPPDPVKRNYPHLPMPLGQYYYYYYYYYYSWQQSK